jgi:Peptidase A4 family
MHRCPKRLLGTALMACVPAIGLLLAFGPAAGASTTSAVGHAPSASEIAAARTFIEHLAIGKHGTDQGVAGHASKIEGLSQVESTNWSGYADTGSGFKSVKAKWTEPSASCGSATSLAAFWVGIDGFSSDSVEQDGTLVECEDGAAVYFSWWEMYPTNDVQVVGETVEPGDSITASVVRSGTSYKLAVTDSTNPANSFSTTQSCTDCANSSAEVIAEAPCCVSGSTVYPLSDFGTFKATGATVATTSKSGSISSFTDDEITMVGQTSGKVKAKPGALTAGGKTFKVTWKRAS